MRKRPFFLAALALTGFLQLPSVQLLAAEIPLALAQEHLPVPYFDSLTILARAAIRFAGGVPIE